MNINVNTPNEPPSERDIEEEKEKDKADFQDKLLTMVTEDDENIIALESQARDDVAKVYFKNGIRQVFNLINF